MSRRCWVCSVFWHYYSGQLLPPVWNALMRTACSRSASRPVPNECSASNPSRLCCGGCRWADCRWHSPQPWLLWCFRSGSGEAHPVAEVCAFWPRRPQFCWCSPPSRTVNRSISQTTHSRRVVLLRGLFAMTVRILTGLLAVVAAIAGLIALWGLAGFSAVIAYRHGQIMAHRCLEQLSIPGGLLQVGVIALVIAGVAVVAMVVRMNHGSRRSAWIAGVYGAVTAPLLVASVILYVTAPQPRSMSPTTCISGDDSHLEGGQ